MELKQRR